MDLSDFFSDGTTDGGKKLRKEARCTERVSMLPGRD